MGAKKKEYINGVVHSDSPLNVRSAPCIGDNVVGTLYNGDKVKIIQNGDSVDFYKISNGNYVMKNYIEIEKDIEVDNATKVEEDADSE